MRSRAGEYLENAKIWFVCRGLAAFRAPCGFVVVADFLTLHKGEFWGVCQIGQAQIGDHRQAIFADEFACCVVVYLIDEAGLDQGGGQCGAAFAIDAGEALIGEFLQGDFAIEMGALGRGLNDFDACGLEARVYVFCRCDDPCGVFLGGFDEFCVWRRAQICVEDYAQRGGGGAGQADIQRGVVGAHCSNPNEHGVVAGALKMGVGAGGRAGDPFALAVLHGDFAVEGGGEF